LQTMRLQFYSAMRRIELKKGLLSEVDDAWF